MSDYDPFPGGPDGPPADDPAQLGTDALVDRRKLAEAVLRAGSDAVDLLHSIVRDQEAETKERRMAAQALLGLSGLAGVTGRAGTGSAGSDPLSGILGILDGAPRSRWAAAAVGRQKCPVDHCDWPAHRGGNLAHGHMVDAGFQDGCNYNHSMMDPCGPVPEGQSTRSDFWNDREETPNARG